MSFPPSVVGAEVFRSAFWHASSSCYDEFCEVYANACYGGRPVARINSGMAASKKLLKLMLIREGH